MSKFMLVAVQESTRGMSEQHSENFILCLTLESAACSTSRVQVHGGCDVAGASGVLCLQGGYSSGGTSTGGYSTGGTSSGGYNSNVGSASGSSTGAAGAAPSSGMSASGGNGGAGTTSALYPASAQSGNAGMTVSHLTPGQPLGCMVQGYLACFGHWRRSMCANNMADIICLINGRQLSFTRQTPMSGGMRSAHATSVPLL